MSQTSSNVTPQAGEAVVRSARGSVLRYRISAWITGLMLIALCVEMVLKYVVKADVSAIDWIPRAHGVIYVLYLVTVFDLWSKMRWSFGRLAAMIFAGVVPIMSFIIEAKIHREATAKIEAAQRALGAQS